MSDYQGLSDIPPGIGTNRNERLHRKIRKWLRRSRIGVCLAVALPSTIFYIHMEKGSKCQWRSKLDNWGGPIFIYSSSQTMKTIDFKRN